MNDRSKTILTIVLGVLLVAAGIAASEKDHAESPPPDRPAVEDHHHGDGHEDHGAKPGKPGSQAKDEHAEDEEAGHESHNDHDDHDDHAGHSDHGAEGEESKGVVVLTEAQKKTVGQIVQTAGSGKLYTELSFPGEVGINEDTLIHIVPRVPGIVLKVLKTIGDKVRAGEVLAVIDSPELGEAKAAYHEVFNEVGCCRVDVARAREVEAGVLRILAALEKKPALDELKSSRYGSTGEQGARLLSAYAEMLLSQGIYQRKEKLFRERLASENDYLQAKTTLGKAQADYFTSRSSAEFAIKQQRLERERVQRVNEFKLKTAERKLRILGLGDHEIERLTKTAMTAATGGEPGPCTDPGCKTCSNHLGKGHDTEEHHFTEFSIVAPGNGTIIEKHATFGERVTGETDVFALADLGTVWVNLRVPARDLPLVKAGMKVLLETQHGVNTEAEIAVVLPTMSLETRTTTARIVLANPNGIWQPGMFVTGHGRIAAENVPVVVPRAAVQNLEGSDVVFVPEGKGFKPVPVVTGRGDRESVEIVSGLSAGSRYVAHGAFDLKAINVTSGAGSHAGHGH